MFKEPWLRSLYFLVTKMLISDFLLFSDILKILYYLIYFLILLKFWSTIVYFFLILWTLLDYPPFNLWSLSQVQKNIQARGNEWDKDSPVWTNKKYLGDVYNEMKRNYLKKMQ